MAGVKRSYGKNGKPHPSWRFWFIDSDGRRKWGTGTANKTETLRIAQKLEEEHRLKRLGILQTSEAEKNRSLPFDDVAEQYLAWGNAQGGRGGRPWSNVHARMRRKFLYWWRDELKLERVGDLYGILPKVEEGLRKLMRQERAGKTLDNYRDGLTTFCRWCV